MKRLLSMTALVATAALLGACNDSSSNRNKAPEPTVEFSTFVQAQFRATSDTTDPVAINGVDFSFNDQNNEQAFDALFIQ